jgi:hypothetical protein
MKAAVSFKCGKYVTNYTVSEKDNLKIIYDV